MASLTAHIMVRNEPLVAYAVRSVLPHVDRVLLWDTGSNDRHTLDDIDRVVAEDGDRKIRTRLVHTDVDETKWNVRTWHKMQVQNRGKYTKGVVRSEMIAATHTDWFMIVDGDEIHYDATMKSLRSLIGEIHQSVLAIGIPLIWMCDQQHHFRTSRSGRLFRTDKVGMRTASPNEMHTDRKTGEPITKDSSLRIEASVRPYLHYETMLKPWRREVPKMAIKKLTLPYPKVMRNDMSFMERWERENKSNKETQ